MSNFSDLLIRILGARHLQLFNTTQKSSATSDIAITNREKEILNLLVEGYSYKMIADKRIFSYATVNKHISNIDVRLQVNSVAAAVSMALREGLVQECYSLSILSLLELLQ
ncbi:MAG: DNA-binding NarL/FixJ family response regulator [Saprospiraceae bacterium]|jgi:DNA-binding NarL/FixJ family response regulator|tara:strand:+ start:957 stop:1289 length:333 start_codon:yes stop_codon:yes gene_type:complete